MKIRATLYIRNAEMLAARQRLKINQEQLAALAGTSRDIIADFEKFDYNHPSIDMLELAERIADILGIEFAQVLHHELLDNPIENKFTRFADIEPSQLVAATADALHCLPSPEEEVEKRDAIERVEKALKALTYRERKILSLRYGLLGEEELYSLEEIARMFKVTRERVRQQEQEAIRKLKSQFTIEDSQWEKESNAIEEALQKG